MFKLYAYIVAQTFRYAVETQDMKNSLMKAIQPIMLIRPNTAPPRMEKYHTELQGILKTIFKEPAKLFNNLFGDKFTTY